MLYFTVTFNIQRLTIIASDDISVSQLSVS